MNKFVWKSWRPITRPLAAGVAATFFSSVLVFAQADWTQRFPAHVPPKRMSTSIAQFGNGSSVVMFGGLNLGPSGVFDQFNVLSDTWIWNGTDWTQFTSFAHPPARYGASMAYDPTSGRAVLFGGKNAAGLYLSDTWVFSTSPTCKSCTPVWSQLSFAAGARPSVRADASMAYDPSAGILLTNGVNASSFLQDTWSFSNSSWTNITINSPTPARSQTPMAQCVQTGNGSNLAMFFGGSNEGGNALSDTWVNIPVEGIGFIWQVFSPSNRPSARFGHGMAYYPVSGLDVLYGGSIRVNEGAGGQVLASDTWNGDCVGPNWNQASPPHNPGLRWRHGMTTGPSGFTVVVFGGSDLLPTNSFPNGRDRDDTWTWGRRVACLPITGSHLTVGSQVNCLFDPAGGVEFRGWSAVGFAPPFRDQVTATFQPESPGPAWITAQWIDAEGAHSQTFNYAIVAPHN